MLNLFKFLFPISYIYILTFEGFLTTLFLLHLSLISRERSPRLNQTVSFLFLIIAELNCFQAREILPKFVEH
jgi:hypothetical protein